MFALCTLVSALALTSESRASEPSPENVQGRSPKDSSVPIPAHCPSTFDGGQNDIGNTSAVAERFPPSLDVQDPGLLAERFIIERLAFWKRHLSLENWQISIVMTRREALKSKTLGGIRWDKGKRSAVISLLDPSDYQLPFWEMIEDMELTVVHELIHLELASLPRSEASRRDEEHAVNRLAEALLKLDRKR